jgi:elongation factor G
MKSAFAIAASALLVGAARAESSPGVVQWSIERRQLISDHVVEKRASTFEEVITNERQKGGYFATCALGTPIQNLTLQLDTGSSDIWVPSPSAEVCRSSSRNSQQGCSFGSCW